jgi:endonuclease YncB( thermonuclease family)
MAYLLTTAILALCVVTSSAAADLQTGRVVHVIDGDGLIVLLGERRLIVRLEHIDAPEQGQLSGTASRQSLIAICGGEVAKIQVSGKDRSGRTLGRVNCNGTDASAEQVRRGMAWVFERYAPAGSPLYKIETEARAARRGVWSQQDPEAPWDWRRRR